MENELKINEIKAQLDKFSWLEFKNGKLYHKGIAKPNVLKEVLLAEKIEYGGW